MIAGKNHTMYSELLFYAGSSHVYGVSGFEVVRTFVTNNSAGNQANIFLKVNRSIN